MLTTHNSGKYLTRSYERDKNAGELDSSNLPADQKTFLEIQDGEGAMKNRILPPGKVLIDGLLYDE